MKLTHPERVIFPERKFTKGDLAAYYRAVAPLLLPFAAHRPLSLVRCPQGVSGHCFFQKHAGESFGSHLTPVMIAEQDGAEVAYIALADSAGLLDCVQMGTIEFHAWASPAHAVEQPDRMIFDLNPDEGLPFAEVTRAAEAIRRQLADLGLANFAMLSGGKGVHVIVPLRPGHSWDAHKEFEHRFAEAMALREPERFVATMSKARRKGRIFIDWLRNQRGSTAVVPYSARARANAGVAAPVSWDELDKAGDAHPYTIADAQALIERAKGADLAGWGLADQLLPEV